MWSIPIDLLPVSLYDTVWHDSGKERMECMNRRITQKNRCAFEQYLKEEEKSDHTVSKYLRDLDGFRRFTEGRNVSKELVLQYKAQLTKRYTVTSANSMIAALNTFLRFMHWEDCCVKQFKIQRSHFCPEERELTKQEYVCLVTAAKRKGNNRLQLILQTLCGTGMRVSELQYITAEAVSKGRAIVSCKNKTRTIFIVRELQKKLLRYIRDIGIHNGCVFVTKSGKPMSRCNIWREMKALCQETGVSPEKVFPHNLRHLFARTFYRAEKDLAKLADLLGHSNINTTRIYIVSTGEEHKRQIERMCLII